MNFIDKIIEYSAKNRVLVLLLGLAAVIGSWTALQNVPLDAIPDLSDTQVIILSRWDRPPQVIEDQVTYPIVAALLGAPKVKDVRAFSDYGFSYVYVIFEDGTDEYWARSRVLEYLSKVTPKLPPDVQTELGPDATGVGWIFEYALVDESGENSLQDLTTFQNWHLKYAVQSVKGVSEVATVGGFVKQYQVIVHPEALIAYGLSLNDVVDSLRKSNQEAGARLLDINGREFMVTLRGYVNSLEDIKATSLKATKNGTSVRIRDVADVVFGPEIRRGVAELDGRGETVGGIVVMRTKENALKVIERVKQRLSEVTLPKGVKLVVTYDRSELINRAVNTLKNKLLEEMIVVSIVILLFLLHFSSAFIPIITLPVAVLLSFIPMYFMGLTSNIMSLGGIAIAIGAMVDASIVVVENSHKRIGQWQDGGRKGNFRDILVNSIKEVGRPSFFSLLVIAVSFLPIFTLEGMEGRLFKPLAYTKTFSIFFAAFLAITLGPALMTLILRVDPWKIKPGWLSAAVNGIFVGKIHAEEKNPISRVLFRIYEPVVRFVLKRPWQVIGTAVLLFLLTIPLLFVIGHEFMPALNEGSILYMPTTPPGISVTEATKLLQVQDRLLKAFPEVVTVFGKAGRADSATDPAPYSMMETVVVLKPQNQWRKIKRHGLAGILGSRRMSWKELIDEMEAALQLPGQVNAWTMPIKARIDMLTTGVRTPVGIKVYGDDLSKVQSIGTEIETLLKGLKGTRSIYAERTAGGYFVNFDLKRDQISRYGLSVEDVQMTLMFAVGGENVTTTIEGRERFPVNVRYPRELRDDVEKLKRVYIATPSGASVPVSQLADVKTSTGPSMIRDENGRLAGYVYCDIANRDIGGWVDEAKRVLKKNLVLPSGYSLTFSGQYELMQRVAERMKLVLPLTLFLIFMLLYINTRSAIKTFIVLLMVPFSLIGAFWALYLLGYNTSIAVWAGIIALLGVDAETGVFMLLFLDLAYDDRKRNGQLNSDEDLRTAIVHGAVMRVRPKLMTAAVLFVGLLPIMWAQSHEIGADVMKRIAAPMVGGILTSFLMGLIVYPAIYYLWKKRSLPSPAADEAAGSVQSVKPGIGTAG